MIDRHWQLCFIQLLHLFLEPYGFPVVKFCHYLIFVQVVGAVWGVSLKALTLLHTELPRSAGVTLAGYFWFLWKCLETLPCGGISIGWYCDGFQNGSFWWENERKRLKEQSYRNSLPTFMLGGLCRVDGASILIFLNVKDNNLKCGVIFGHYLEVWACNTQLLDASKRTDTNKGQSTI